MAPVRAALGAALTLAAISFAAASPVPGENLPTAGLTFDGKKWGSCPFFFFERGGGPQPPPRGE